MPGRAVPSFLTWTLFRCQSAQEIVRYLGGATFRELLDNDLDDEAARASDEQYARDQIDAMMEAVTRILEDASK